MSIYRSKIVKIFRYHLSIYRKCYYKYLENFKYLHLFELKQNKKSFDEKSLFCS